MTKVPPTQMLILVVLLLGGLGFAGYQYMYTPAKEARTLAETELNAARDALGVAEAELDRVESAGPDFAELSKVGVSSVAVPARPDEADALLELARIGRQSRVRILEWSAAPVDTASSLPGAAPVDSGPRTIAMTITGHARYPDLVGYVDRIESTVRVEDGKAYVRGRLFNVVNMEITPAEASSTSEGENPVGVPLDGNNYVQYTLIIHIFSRSEPAATGTVTDPAAAADPAAAGATAGTAPAEGPTAGAPAPGADASAGGNTTTTPAASADGAPVGAS